VIKVLLYRPVGYYWSGFALKVVYRELLLAASSRLFGVGGCSWGWFPSG
jgi:hypothetical protein